MITPTRLKKKFEDYRKWFYTFLAKEFLNLPVKNQEKFLLIARKFVENCEKVYKEAKNIKERKFIINVEFIQPPKDNICVVIGNVLEISKEVRISLPMEQVPSVGENIECILFSLDEDAWYSSKEALIITGR